MNRRAATLCCSHVMKCSPDGIATVGVDAGPGAGVSGKAVSLRGHSQGGVSWLSGAGCSQGGAHLDNRHKGGNLKIALQKPHAEIEKQLLLAGFKEITDKPLVFWKKWVLQQLSIFINACVFCYQSGGMVLDFLIPIGQWFSFRQIFISSMLHRFCHNTAQQKIYVDQSPQQATY